MTIKLYKEYGLHVLLYKYCHINLHIIASFARLTIGTMVSLYKSQVSTFAKDSETAVLWMITFFLVIAYMKIREVGAHLKSFLANIKINVYSMREKDDMVVLDKRIK